MLEMRRLRGRISRSPSVTGLDPYRIFTILYAHRRATARRLWRARFCAENSATSRRRLYQLAIWDQLLPASRLGPAVISGLRPFKLLLDREFRHLPKSSAGTRRLLDVEWGNGFFLSSAQACGWDVVGPDPDPQAELREFGGSRLDAEASSSSIRRNGFSTQSHWATSSNTSMTRSQLSKLPQLDQRIVGVIRSSR